MIKIYKSEDMELWARIGRTTASKAFKKEMPYFYDDDFLWFVSRQGFGACYIKNKVGYLKNLYVSPEYRNNGEGRSLIQSRVNYLSSKVDKIKVTANKYSFPILLSEGFVKIGNRGSYSYMVKNV